MSHSKIEMDIGLCAFNLETNADVKESLEKLEKMETPMEYLKIHNIMDLAKKFMMTPGVKDEARKLIAKIRRIEGVSSRAVSGSPTEQENRKRSREPTPEEMMLCSKRTAPVKYAGKKRVSDVPPEEMTLGQLQEFVREHPRLAGSVDEHFKKFVIRDFPSASRYPKPPFYTWCEFYEQFEKNSSRKVSKEEKMEKKQEEPKEEKKQDDDKENKEKEKKRQSKEDEKLKAFLERKKATAVRKNVTKSQLIETAAFPAATSLREALKQSRLQNLNEPMPPAKKSRKRF